MVLKVINGKKERHDSAQAEIDRFNSVVIGLNGAPHLKNSDDVQCKTHHSHEYEDEENRWNSSSVRRYFVSHNADGDDGPKNSHYPGTQAANEKRHEIACAVELPYKPCLHKKPYQREKPAEPTDQQHERPVQVRWDWIRTVGLGRGGRSAVDRPACG